MRILAVEDERIVARGLRLQLNNLGYEVPTVAASRHEALDLIEKARPDLVLMDIRMNGRPEGIDAAREIRDRFDIPVIFLTAHSDRETLSSAKETDPFGYLVKPAQDRELLAAIEVALHKHKIAREMRARSRQQTAANRLGVRALANLGLQTLLDETCATVEELLSADVCEVLELLPGGETLLLKAGTGWPAGLIGNATIDLRTSGLLPALQSNEPLFVDQPDFAKRFLASPCDLRPAGGVAVAIAGQSEPYGILGIYSCQSREFTPMEVEFLQSISTIIGWAIERKRGEQALENVGLALQQALREKESLIGRLEGALQEKTVLLQEVHHRVKNNLAVVASLLSSQANRVGGGTAAARLLETRQRVISMALMHQQLYATADLCRIPFGEYIEKLALEVRALYQETIGAVEVKVDAEPFLLTIENAIPCALILNEILTNAFKYAFPDSRSGEVRMTVRLRDGLVEVSCVDNGIGLPAGFEEDRADSFGLRIVQILVKQIRGHFSIGRNFPGTQFKMSFPQDRTSRRGG